MLDDVVAEVVGLPVGNAPLRPAAGQPHAEITWMVVAAVGVFGEGALRIDGAAKLPSPHHQCLIEHAPLLEILDKRCRGLIGIEALRLEIVGKIAMLIPAPMENLHRPHPPLHQPAGQQQAVRERPRLLYVVAIHLQRRGGFAGKIGQLRHARLHPEGHLILRDTGLDLGIVKAVESQAVEPAEPIEHLPAIGSGDPRRIGQIEHRVARAAQRHPAVPGGEEPARPHPREEGLRGIDVGQRCENHKGGEIVALAPQAIRHPAPQARLAWHLAAGHHERAGGIMVDGVGVDRLHQRDLVDHIRGVGEEFAVDPAAAAAPLLKFEFGRGHRKPGLAAGHAGEPLIAPHTRRDILVEIVVELWFVIPQIDLRGAAIEVDVDHPLGSRSVVRQTCNRRVHPLWLCRCRQRRPPTRLRFKQPQRHPPQADAAGAQKRPPGGERLGH